jgi:hypothetical protein
MCPSQSANNSRLSSATGPADSPRNKKKVNAFELLGSAMDISNLFEVRVSQYPMP